MNGDDMTQTEFTLALVKREWLTAERERIIAAINEIDPIEWALGAAHDQVLAIVRAAS